MSGTTHTEAGTYNGDPWSFTGTANYNNQNGTVDDKIDKANARSWSRRTTSPTTASAHGDVYDDHRRNGETGATVGTST